MAAGRCAVVVGPAGSVGLDIETIARIELNATSQDSWLAPDERSLIDGAKAPAMELACRWVLKEAYGKALGVGLALPLDQLSFRSRRGGVSLEGAAAPPRSDGWAFRLYRHADLIVGLAARADRQAAMPFAPVGRKPPTPLLDR
ncbi:4'-phosphopantetheinyl transferase family protein [Sphingomonas bacterium]|uniref:4'-phosphopantetheinyl transferase family protein n=1 Tax=Sphingomonas bacterium TaxID=1895847 RepID=UPI0015764FE8|nr:4'-phosphopantetheinyl transferase superfamily protein [Sphingomonas bacterium]